MSRVFSNTTKKDGLVQQYERHTLQGDGAVSGDTTKLAMFTADANLAHDKFLILAIKAAGKWQVDDTNLYETDGVTLRRYPFVTIDIASGQKDYPFTTDGEGNLILDIYKVFLRTATTAPYLELDPVDLQSDEGITSMIDGLETQGVPTAYDKTQGSIILNYVPNFNCDAGLKMFINREGSYFLSSDTTKKPGYPGLLHDYFFIEPAWRYAALNGLKNFGWLDGELKRLEKDIEQTFSKRARDERSIMTMKKINYI